MEKFRREKRFLMGIGDILIIGLIVFGAAFAVRHCKKNKGCCGSCKGCANSGSCSGSGSCSDIGYGSQKTNK